MEVKANRIAAGRGADLWNGLPEQARLLFQEKGTLVEFEPGDQMMAPGDPGNHVRLILAGKAGVYLREDGFSGISVDALGPGDVYGEISFLTGQAAPRNSELVAEEHCRVLEAPGDVFDAILTDSPALSHILMRNLARKVARLERSVFSSKQKKRALKSLISREQHIFPDYVIGDYVRRHVSAAMEQLAASEEPVLIAGEAGVGKEVLAHAIFRMSVMYKEVFLLIDLLSAGPENPFDALRPDSPHHKQDPTEDQMRLFFGQRVVQPDGSLEVSPGYVELTEDGTLLVRGVEHLTPETQQALLDAATTGTYHRPGDDRVRKCSFRLLATSELDLSEISPERHPLIDGLCGHALRIPPLRKRRREIPTLVNQYLARHCKELHKEVPTVPRETLKTLLGYSWPGNDLELSATLKRALLTANDTVLRPNDVYFRLTRVEDRGRIDLLKFRPVRRAMLSPLFPAVLQSAVTPFFFILLGLLFLGPPDPLKNPASLFSWALGWPALVGGAFLWARFWCSLCPMGTLGHLAKKLIALEKPFPAFLKSRSDLLVVGAVLFIIWIETATDMRNSPFNVGLLLLVVTLCSVFVSVVFERQSWCRYLCPLGGMTGVMERASAVELRANQNICASQCKSPECYFGNEKREGCPLGQVAPTLQSNLDCKLCGNCVKNCPHGAITLNLRIPGLELLAMQRTNTGTAFLVISMLGGLISELVRKMPVYELLTAGVPLPEWSRFSGEFLVVVAGVNIVFAIAAAASHRLSGDAFQENYARFGMALLPLTLTSFLAYHVYYLINLGVQLPILVSQNFDLALFKQLIITVRPEITHLCQQILVGLGLVWSLFIMFRLGRASHESPLSGAIRVTPHAALAIGLAVVVLYALKESFYGGS